MLAYIAAVHSPTFDEPVHLAAGLRRLERGQFDLALGNPTIAGVLPALAVSLAGVETDWSRAPDSFAVGQDLATANGERFPWLVVVGRVACIPFSVLGAYVCFRWARELYGGPSGWLALILWCVCPNVLGHGALITADVAAMSLGALAAYCFWRWLAKPGWLGAAWAGLSLGLAELSKFVWAPLYLGWPIVWLITSSSARRGTSRWRQPAQLAGILLTSIAVVNSGYLFDQSFSPINRYGFGVDLLQTLGGERADLPIRCLGAVPVPLPGSYVRGIEAVERWCGETRRSFLHGKWSEQGWWYYYLVGLGLKLPLGMLLLLIIAAAVSVIDRRHGADQRAELLLLGLPLFVVFFVSIVTSQQSHVRYAFPALPFLFVWASKSARASRLRSRYPAGLMVFAASWTIVSSLATYPHALSYANELAGGPRHAADWLLDSNVDWGQDVAYLKLRLDARSGPRPLHVAYFGSVDPTFLGIEFRLPPTASELGLIPHGDKRAPRRALTPGLYAVSANLLHGYSIVVHDGGGKLTLASPDDFSYFRRLIPLGTAGYSIYLYDIDERQANRLFSNASRSHQD